MGRAFDHAKERETLDLDAAIQDFHALMTKSGAWWPADFGHHGSLCADGIVRYRRLPCRRPTRWCGGKAAALRTSQ
jgi:hypothetical protein